MSKSILEWFTLTKTGERKVWSDFYKMMLGRTISQPDRFFGAVDRFGHSIMFEAIVASSTKKFSDDCLDYVLAVAYRKVNEEIEDITEEDRYRMSLDKAKLRTQMQNEEALSKIEKAKEMK